MAIVLLRARTVRVDVVDVLGVHARLTHRVVDRLGHVQSIRFEPGHVVRVAAAREPGDLAVDVRTASHRTLELFDDQDGTAFAHHEPVAVAVEWTRRVLGVVVAMGRGLDRVEAGHRDRGDRRLRCAGDDDVRLVVLDHVVGVADRVDAGRAAG